MISTKNELEFYMKADLIMNRGIEKLTFKNKVKNFIFKDHIMSYLITLRKYEYYSSKFSRVNQLRCLVSKIKLKYLGIKLGFSIEPNVFGYGLVLPHYGTIVVGKGNKIGNYAVIHTSTCITAGTKIIGDALYLSCGGKIIKNIKLASNITVGANSVVNHSFLEENIMIAGSPSIKIKKADPWFIRDGKIFKERYDLCEELRRGVLQ